MKHKILALSLLGLSFILVSTASLAGSYALYTTNKTQDEFSLKSGLSNVGLLKANEKLVKFEFNDNDSVLFISDNVPRLTVKYDPDNQRPRCFDLFQGYTCDFTKMPGTSSYLLTIEK